ncbi:MAG: hypothetical protein KME45_00895 [Stenomitos rutilans HA7619-LM2]|jgi:hypothetical protein|nr:hypothetical protein [Stenomitos rutilans HA7619-LM2]
MFKRFSFLMSGISAVLMTMPAGAIAPGADKIGACGSFTASKYRVSGNQLIVKISQRTAYGYLLDWSVKPYGAAGYCFVTNANQTTQWVVRRGPRPETIALGPNEKLFSNLPGYGDVVVNRGQSATGDKQYFLVRPISTARSLTWYARCGNNRDQVYDASGQYVGYDARMSVMFPYVCEFSPLKPNPPLRPQPK